MEMNITLLTEKIFAEIIAANGGRVFRVGGCVRDWFMGLIPKDIDFCVVGMVKKNFKAIFPEAQECGKSFPVFRLQIDGMPCEVAFARTERKVGRGYRGFKVSSNPKVSIEEDLFRRDTTVNSIAIDSLTEEIIDPFHGREDIKNRILRATSQHFSDDPMRALRLAGQAARLNFEVDGDTLKLAAAVSSELAEEPVERMAAELTKVLVGSSQPGRFFKVLAEANLLQTVFKELSELSSECFAEAIMKLDLVAQVTTNPKVRFAAFGLMLDKEELSAWNQRMTLPGAWFESAVAVSRIQLLLKKLTAEKVVDAIHSLRRGSLKAEELDIISAAVGLNIPALSPLQTLIMQLPTEAVPPHLKGREVGDWLRVQQVKILSKEVRCLKCE